MTLMLIFIFGLVMGSVLNFLIYVLTKDESIAIRPLHCKFCEIQLKILDLIPVLSWLLHRGKCRYCGEKKHYRYPVTEFVNAMVWVLIIWQWGLTLQGLFGLFLFSLSLVISQIDLEHYIIPNRLVLILLLFGIMYHILVQDLTLLNRFFGLVLGFIVPFLMAVISRGGMGAGDIKLMAAIGWWLGFPGVIYALFVGSLLGSIIGVILITLRLKKRKDPIPFGPFLVFGFLIIFFTG